MAMKHFKPYTPSRRNMTSSTFEEITKKANEILRLTADQV